MPDWIIAPMDLDRDLDEIAALDTRCFTNPTTRDMFRREAETSDVAHVYVMRPSPSARDASPDAAATSAPSPLVAYCSVWLIFDELHINTLAVDPDRRREGLASILLTHVLADAARRGATKATLEVRRSNEAARKLYERFGFELGGVRPAYYRSPVEDALILWRLGLPAPAADAPPDPSATADRLA